ncbi:MAG: hypothetical protein LIO65_10525 [Odoribacter sp.]|nr:hypothetical protein [Odoribacter sp.]
MKNILFNTFFAFCIFTLISCDDFFITNPDDILNSDDYIGADSEIYTGFLGILSKMQDIGDHSIYLTGLRAHFLEPTSNAPQELWDIYNYADLQGNSHADPIGYYALIIACNDYIHKMFEYKASHALDETTETHFTALISSAIRIKVWTYLKLGQIYGKVLYFDDPLTELADLKNSAVFSELNGMEQIANKCLDLLDNGVNEINGTHVMNWTNWINPDNENQEEIVFWNYVVPDWLLLRSELLLWLGKDYVWVKENILTYLADLFTKETEIMRLSAIFTSNVRSFFSEGQYYRRVTVSAIVYSYNNRQTNNLFPYFAIRYPNEYYIRPTSYGTSLYTSSDDARIDVWFRNQDGDTTMAKYHYDFTRREPYQSDASVTLYRAHDYHFFLAEAENMLGHWDQCKTLLNNGVGGRFTTNIVDTTLAGWDIRYQNFIDNSSSRPNLGICGFQNATQHDLPTPDDADYDLTEEERIYIYDMALLDEMVREYPGEGRLYGMLIRMAKKYNDYSIVADRIVPKYPESMQAEIRQKIMNGGYFVEWDLYNQ